MEMVFYGMQTCLQTEKASFMHIRAYKDALQEGCFLCFCFKKSGLPIPSNPLYLVIAEGDTSYFVNPTSYLI